VDSRATVHLVFPEAPDGVLPFSEIGDYELLKEIGRGGMGVIYQARQRSLDRVVALKLIRAGALAKADGVARFKQEAAATARLRHPGIVAVHDVGEHEGHHFYSMDLVPGRSLAAALHEGPLAPRPAADCVRAVAEAIHFAHERGVIHRDLKPSNILLDGEGEPHVSDFGLAKLLQSDSELTLSGAVLGSPSYMPPEQARGQHAEVSARSDVYALGAILYECLTGRPPFAAATPLETMKLVVEQDAIAPRAINPALPRDLETICLKCLQKAPSHRYATAQSIADELGRFLRNEPIQARPSTMLERSWKWAYRHPARAALAALAVVAPAVIITVLMVMGGKLAYERNIALQHGRTANTAATRAETEARQANDARAETRQNLYAADMLLAQHALDDGNLGLARRLVDAYRGPQRMTDDALRMTIGTPSPTPPSGRGNEVQTQKDRDLLTPAAISADLRGFEWRHLWKRCRGEQLYTLHGHSDGVYCVAFSPDGTLLASGDEKGAVKLWDVASRSLVATLAPSQVRIVRVSFSADGQALATADYAARIKIWKLSLHKVVWSGQASRPEGVQLSPAGTRIGFTRGNNREDTNSTALVVDYATGQEVLRVPAQADFQAFSPDGKRAFIAAGEWTELWDIETGQRLTRFSNPKTRHANVAAQLFVAPDGQSAAALPYIGTEINLFHLTDKRPARLSVSGGFVTSVAFSPAGALLAGSSTDQTVRLWEAVSQREVARLLGHTDSVMGVAFSPDGRLLATASADHTVMLWLTTGQKDAEVMAKAGNPHILSPDGTKLAGLASPSSILIADVDTLQSTVLSHAGETLVPEFFSADSKALIARGRVTSNGVLPLLRWNLHTPTTPPTITLLNLESTNRVWDSAASPMGPVYALFQLDTQDVSLWNPLTGDALARLRGQPKQPFGGPVRFSRDGRKLASYVYPNSIKLSDLATPDKVAVAQLPVSYVRPVEFSHDGQILGVPCSDHTIRLWDVARFRELAVLSGHQQTVNAVAFSSDGRTLASCSEDGTVKLWCLPARREVATLLRSAIGLSFLAFTSDGRTLLAGSWMGLVYRFRVPTLAEIESTP
jgi:WD40 repeat protein